MDDGPVLNNEASGRPIDEKYPTDPDGFAPQRPEFEIVGAFATDPVRITRIISGDGVTPEAPVTVDTATPTTSVWAHLSRFVVSL